MAGAALLPGESLTLRLPLDPGYLTTARLFAAAAGRQLGLAEEMIEDVKLAISEGCTGAISASPSRDGLVNLSVTVLGGLVNFRLSTSGSLAFGHTSADTQAWAGISDTVGLEVLQALFEEARVEATPDGGSAISFSAPVATGGSTLVN